MKNNVLAAIPPFISEAIPGFEYMKEKSERELQELSEAMERINRAISLPENSQSFPELSALLYEAWESGNKWEKPDMLGVKFAVAIAIFRAGMKAQRYWERAKLVNDGKDVRIKIKNGIIPF